MAIIVLHNLSTIARQTAFMDKRDGLPYRPSWVPWAITSLALIVVALGAYAFGAEHQVVFDGGGGRHMWFFPGFGFWIFILIFWGFWRRMWWGYGPWGYPYRPWRYRRYYRHAYDDEDERAEWEEWHRDAHRRGERREERPEERPPSNL
jgi:amino acid transporter